MPTNVSSIVRTAERNARRMCQDLARQGYPWHANGYQVVYMSADGREWCDECARQQDADPAIELAAIHWEGADKVCDGCGATIPSEYGDPWADPLNATPR